MSDLHINDDRDPIYRIVLNFLESEISTDDTVVFAGDIFDVFVGSKRIFIDRYRDFFHLLEKMSARGIKIYYIEGNHDFILKKSLPDCENVHWSPKEVQLNLDGKSFFISHGDQVNGKDIAYLLLRLFFRSPLMQAMVFLTPDTWFDWYGKKHSRYSRERKPLLPEMLCAEKLEELRKMYRNFAVEKMREGFDFVVMGHCHDLDEMRFQISGRSTQYINMGYPKVHRSILKWTASEGFIIRKNLPIGTAL